MVKIMMKKYYQKFLSFKMESFIILKIMTQLMNAFQIAWVA